MFIYAISAQSRHFCPLNGPKSSAPNNEKDFVANLDVGLAHLQHGQEKVGKQFDRNVVSTCMNEEAAMYNFPAFIESAASTIPSLTLSLLVFCLDEPACIICRDSILEDAQCIFMDLGVAGGSLAPGGKDKHDADYWRLTYGRVFATVSLVRPGINALPVDVDAVFLQNPFAPGNGLHERPNDLAVVADIAPFTFKYGDKTPLNGGFLYFPGVDEHSYQFSKEVVDRVWAKNCHPKNNEQLVTSSVLRFMSKKYVSNFNYRPYMLPVSQYLNLCSTECGTGDDFRSIQSLADLKRMEETWGQKATFSSCSSEGRKKWVYFHAACLNKEIVNGGKAGVAKAKGEIQKAVYAWAKS